MGRMEAEPHSAADTVPRALLEPLAWVSGCVGRYGAKWAFLNNRQMNNTHTHMSLVKVQWTLLLNWFNPLQRRFNMFLKAFYVSLYYNT